MSESTSSNTNLLSNSITMSQPSIDNIKLDQQVLIRSQISININKEGKIFTKIKEIIKETDVVVLKAIELSENSFPLNKIIKNIGQISDKLDICFHTDNIKYIKNLVKNKSINFKELDKITKNISLQLNEMIDKIQYMLPKYWIKNIDNNDIKREIINFFESFTQTQYSLFEYLKIKTCDQLNKLIIEINKTVKEFQNYQLILSSQLIMSKKKSAYFITIEFMAELLTNILIDQFKLHEEQLLAFIEYHNYRLKKHDIDVEELVRQIPLITKENNKINGTKEEESKDILIKSSKFKEINYRNRNKNNQSNAACCGCYKQQCDIF